MNPTKSGIKLRSAAWLLMGLTGSLPGILELHDHKITYTAYGCGALTGGQLRRLERMTQIDGLVEKLRSREQIILLTATVSDIAKIVYPWYYFNGGVGITVGRNTYRFSFLQPQNAKYPLSHCEQLSELTNLLKDVHQGQAQGKAWRKVLNEAWRKGMEEENPRCTKVRSSV